MKCPCCGAAELTHDTRDVRHTHNGEATSIPAVIGEFCPACGEVILNREQGDRYSGLIGQCSDLLGASQRNGFPLFPERKDATLVTPELVNRLRDEV